MRVGIDARPLQAETRFRGIGKTLENTLAALSTMDLGDTELVFFVEKQLEIPAVLTSFPHAKLEDVHSSSLRRLRYFRAVVSPFKHFSVAPKNIDVFVQYDAALGIPKQVPSLVVFYDLIPLLFKDQEQDHESIPSTIKRLKRGFGRRLHWRKYMQMLDRYRFASHILSISAASKRDLLKHRPEIADSNVTVVPLGVSATTTDKEVSSETKELASSPFLLYVGGIDVRKNIMTLLTDFIILKKDYPELRLILVGKEFGLTAQLTAIGWNELLALNPKAAKDVLTPGYMNDSDLRYLYSQARAFVFPSRYEGFGLPVLEAMQAGCPVIAYNNSSIPEVAGDAALLLEDGQPMQPAIRQLLDSDELRQELIRKGKEQVRDFTWHKTAEETLRLIRNLNRDNSTHE